MAFAKVSKYFKSRLAIWLRLLRSLIICEHERRDYPAIVLSVNYRKVISSLCTLLYLCALSLLVLRGYDLTLSLLCLFWISSFWADNLRYRTSNNLLLYNNLLYYRSYIFIEYIYSSLSNADDILSRSLWGVATQALD